jgi:O-antigen ligase
VAWALLTRDLRLMKAFLQVSYAVMALLLVASLAVSIQPDRAARALALTLIAVFVTAGAYALPRDAGALTRLLALAATVTVGLAWAGVIALPDLAIHSDTDLFEPEHAGSWKGHFTHKNIAGAMMALMAFIGVYVWRMGQRGAGALIVIGAVLFLTMTRSKTSFMLFPIAFAAPLIAERARSLPLRLALCLTPVALLLALTLGSALSPDIRAFNLAWLGDPSFTGRYDLWRFGFEKMEGRWLTGYGFDSFWGADWTLRGESKLELAWEVQKMLHGHNGYLDVLLMLGLPGLLAVLYVFGLKPVLDYHHCRRTRENQLFATLCLMMWLFIMMGSCLEVFFFRRVDPIWFSLLFAVFGLRMAASYPIRPAER